VQDDAARLNRTHLGTWRIIDIRRDPSQPTWRKVGVAALAELLDDRSKAKMGPLGQTTEYNPILVAHGDDPEIAAEALLWNFRQRSSRLTHFGTSHLNLEVNITLVQPKSRDRLAGLICARNLSYMLTIPNRGRRRPDHRRIKQ
jgi:hypothetical protein